MFNRAFRNYSTGEYDKVSNNVFRVIANDPKIPEESRSAGNPPPFDPAETLVTTVVHSGLPQWSCQFLSQPPPGTNRVPGENYLSARKTSGNGLWSYIGRAGNTPAPGRSICSSRELRSSFRHGQDIDPSLPETGVGEYIGARPKSCAICQGQWSDSGEMGRTVQFQLAGKPCY
jgi:hypothetical protein